LACPDKTPGQVSLYFYKESNTKENTIQIKAHNSVLSCMELDNRGLKLATASEKVRKKCIVQPFINLLLGDSHSNFQHK